ncbi:MAG TPA: sigma-54 dependent transcriptional regulator [Kofleriaceae bacterium]|jgi:DNA-binding NtrC family response regulator
MIVSVVGKPWVGVSAAHRGLLTRIETVALADAEVLITGPSGVGKENYARHVHDASRRARGEFVAVNCGSIPDELFENELFGHVGGAFTGARPTSEGLVASAEGGTLFLDELDTLSQRNQIKLLRFIQDKQYRRLGEARPRRANVRIVAATNANLVEAVHAGRFREDLLFRIRVIPIEVPALRERPEDIDVLFEAYASWYANVYELARIVMLDAAMTKIRNYAWPGNIRELENCVHYLTCLRLTRAVDPADLPLLTSLSVATPPPPSSLTTPGTLPTNLNEAKSELVNGFEASVVRLALDEHSGNITHAARAVGKPRRAFFELMRRHGIRARSSSSRSLKS